LSARLIHCLANIWLVLPFTHPDAAVGDEYAITQESSLLRLHFVENILVVVASRLGFFYLHEGVWPWRLHLYCDLPIMLAMLLAFAFHRLYHSKLNLFASVPATCLPVSVISARQQLLMESLPTVTVTERSLPMVVPNTFMLTDLEENSSSGIDNEGLVEESTHL